MNRPRVAAIVPMRHDSKRVPGKNWRPLGGRPLFEHVILALQECDCVDRIVIDTDSPVIRSIAQKDFPDVMVLQRPEHLRDDTLPMNDVLLHTITQVPADIYIQTHSTNPLLRADTITRAFSSFVQSQSMHDSLFSVSRLQQRLWDGNTKPVNHNPAILQRTQDLPPIFAENSCLYIFCRQTLEKRKNRIGATPMMFEIDRGEAWDIDEEIDFQVAELMFEAMQRQRRSAA